MLPSRSCTLPTVLAALAALLAGLSTFYAAGNIQHAPGGPPQVAFVEFPLILRESAAGKSLNAQVAPKLKALQDDAQAKIKEFKQEQDELERERESLDSAEINDRQQALQKRIGDWNVSANQREAQLKDAANAVVKGIHEVLRAELAAIAEENGYAAILPAEQAFYAQTQLDVTAEAMRRLDRKISKVELPADGKK